MTKTVKRKLLNAKDTHYMLSMLTG